MCGQKIDFWEQELRDLIILKMALILMTLCFLAKELKKLKADYVAVTSGGIKPKTNIKFFLAITLNLQERIKKS